MTLDVSRLREPHSAGTAFRDCYFTGGGVLIPLGAGATVQPLWSRQYLDFLGQGVS